MGHNHSHSSHNHTHGRGKRLGLTILLNIIITVSQYIGGVFTGSLALMSDATHNFSDVIALIISWIADKLAKTEYTQSRTYGLKRAEVIAAVINVITILFIAFNIFFEAISRLNEPTIIKGPTVMLLAGLSIIVNGLSVLIVKKDAENNMNMKSAYLHLFSDMLTSFAVLFVGVLMFFFNIYWLDSVVSIGISIFLLVSSVRLLLDTLKVLMHFTPSHIDLKVLQLAVKNIEKVKDIHHLHIWQLTDNDIQMSAHIDIDENMPLKDTTVVYDALNTLLKETFGIHHTTLQLEYGTNHKSELIYDESQD